MLTNDAQNKQLINIIERQCNAYVTVGPNVNIPFVRPVTNNIILNLKNKPEQLNIKLSANDWKYLPDNATLDISLEDNTLFELTDSEVKIVNNEINIGLKRRNNMTWNDLENRAPRESVIHLHISTNDNIKILDPVINVTIRNYQEKVLTLEFK
jgi:hypothetical protein